MDDFTPWLLILAVFGVFAIIMFSAMFRAQRNQDLKRFANQWSARILPGGFFEPPGLSFRLDELPVTLDYTQYGEDSTHTHLTIPLPGARLRLELRPQTVARQLGKYLGMQDIEIGSSEFDAAFIIQGSNPRQIQEFLAANVQAAIMRLARCGGHQGFDLHLVLSGGSLRITKHQHLSTEADLSRFATACRDLLRTIRQAATVGIEFVAQPQPRPVAETECQVCGDPLTGKIVFCTKCKTPHHLDCWQYFGSCATYGCGQKRYVEAPRSR